MQPVCLEDMCRVLWRLSLLRVVKFKGCKLAYLFAWVEGSRCLIICRVEGSGLALADKDLGGLRTTSVLNSILPCDTLL